MRVKQLDLLGFKSFAIKTSIRFEPGVTAIVGPNGSGKSNLVDAIRWVLGEHNPRDVRAPRLEDVIFNGTDTKAPLSMAEISLMIDNEQGLLPIAFTEILVTRRVYRSGESECFINQSPCRLKDIQELFLGTGLGGGTYAIIEQGHIDLILSSKPEERRGVFEEASGVAKYLAKKQETVRRLDEVEQHLTRVADIIAEVRRQVSALERQAAKARQYKTQWEQLKTWELRLAAHELRQGQDADHALQQLVESLTQKRHALEANKQRLLASLEACHATVAHTQARLQALRTRVVESTSELEQQTSQLALKGRWIDELAMQRQQVVQEAGQLEQRAAQLAQQLEHLTAQQAACEQQHQETLQRRAHATEELTRVDQQLAESLTRLEQVKVDLFGAASAASQQRNTLTSLTLRGQTLATQLGRTQQQRGVLQTRLEELLQRQQQLERERTSFSDQHTALQHQLALARQSLSRAQGERHELMGRLNHVRERVVTQRAQVQLLEEMWRRYEGFPDSVKTVLASRPQGVLGLLADLLEPRPGYEQALEAALGPLVFAIVVQDRHALTRCQELLTSQDLEGAQFVVLADCPHQAATSESGSVPEGFVGALKQFVRYDPTYELLVEWLLGSWSVVRGIKPMLLAPPTQQRAWVTPSADRWDGRSWQLAGSRRAQSARIGRKRRWEQAREALEALERDVAATQTTWQRAEDQWQTLVANEERVKQEAEQLTPTVTKVEAQLAQLAHEAKRLQEELTTCELDQGDLLRQQRESGEAEGAARQAVSDAEGRQQQLEQILKDQQAQREEAGQRRQRLDVLLAQLETTLASVAERRETTQARLHEIQAEQAQTTTNLEGKRTQAQDIVEKSTGLTQQLEAHQERVAILTHAHAPLNAEVAQIAQELHEEERRRDQVLPSVFAAEQELLTLTHTLQGHESQLTERAFRRTRILERLQDVYHVEEALVATEQAHLTALTDEERRALAEQVERLKSKLEAMGPVSLGSVEEYDELKQRLEFLHTQQQDLVKAREDLRHSITQINRTARQQFRETFAKIQEEFRHYFTKLFGGGEANLILMDEEDVLESGIEITARPPGKRLQSISLLSGGERALTAIALLFALFKVRPSPFCILDEIDAPLDEANIDRFTKVLEEFLSLSQFILITHNKKTITKADCLYGVTMEQPGVSKLVSVKLTKAKRPAPAQPAEPVEQAGAVAL